MQVIITKYFGAGAKGSRIKATAGKNYIYFNRDNALSMEQNYREAARALCNKLDWKGELVGGIFPDGSMAWVFNCEANYDRFTI